MVNFFRSVTDFFASIWTLLSNLLSSMFQAIQIVTQVPVAGVTLIPFVPAVLGTCITIVLAVGIVKLILGWGNS